VSPPQQNARFVFFSKIKHHGGQAPPESHYQKGRERRPRGARQGGQEGVQEAVACIQEGVQEGVETPSLGPSIAPSIAAPPQALHALMIK